MHLLTDKIFKIIFKFKTEIIFSHIHKNNKIKGNNTITDFYEAEKIRIDRLKHLPLKVFIFGFDLNVGVFLFGRLPV